MTDDQKDGPEPIDVYVGARITERRRELGLTQADLATALSLTFQQVQKYEKGTNRVSASRLWQTAAFLKLPINAFFPEDPDGSVSTDDLIPISPEARKIEANVRRLSQGDQAMVAGLLRRLAKS